MNPSRQLDINYVSQCSYVLIAYLIYSVVCFLLFNCILAKKTNFKLAQWIQSGKGLLVLRVILNEVGLQVYVWRLISCD